jgi:uncharacterized protein (TIGR03067 family)
MKRLGFLAVVFLSSVSWSISDGNANQDDANQADLKKLQGKWKPEVLIRSGMPDSPERASIWIISGSKVFYPKFNSEEEIILNAFKSPKEIDIRVKQADGQIREFKGIYAFEGERLQICQHSLGKDRPTTLESKAGSGHVLMTLERIKE